MEDGAERGTGVAISSVVTAKLWSRVCSVLGTVLRAVYTYKPHSLIERLKGASHEPCAGNTTVNMTSLTSR